MSNETPKVPDDFGDDEFDQDEEESAQNLLSSPYHPITEPGLKFQTLTEALTHDRLTRNYDLISELPAHDDDDFHEKAIVLINKSRSFIRDGKDIAGVGAYDEEADWEFFKPVLRDDAFLMNLEELRVMKSNLVEGNVEDHDETREMLKMRITAMEDQLRMAKDCISNLYSSSTTGAVNSASTASRDKKRQDENDSNYFSSYSSSYIHEVMLKDVIRTTAYQKSITPDNFKDKIVLDVGCGTGILSLFAAKAGAKRVYAVDDSGILESATKEIIRTNGYEGVIIPLKGKMEDITLPEQVDIIISEWMGYALLFESMLPSVIHARDRYMNPEGAGMFPNVARLFIEGATATNEFSYWDDVYGFDMTCVKTLIHNERSSKLPSEGDVVYVPKSDIVTTRHELKSFDLNKCAEADLDFQVSFSFGRKEPIEGQNNLNVVTIHKLVVSFDVLFPGGVCLDTTSDERVTHWKQTSFWLKDSSSGEESQLPLLGKGDVMNGTYEMKKGLENSREMEVSIVWEVLSSEGDKKQSGFAISRLGTL